MKPADGRRVSMILRLAGELRSSIEAETPPALPGSPAAERIEYDPVDFWRALARFQATLLTWPDTDDAMRELAFMTYRVVHDGDVLADPRTATTAEGLRVLAVQWRQAARATSAEHAETLARLLLGEPLP